MAINPLSVISFAKIYSPSIGCILLYFVLQKFISLIWSHLLIFAFISFTLVDGIGASQVVLVVKNPPDNAGDIRDMSSIPG